jgi:hypothetical protein
MVQPFPAKKKAIHKYHWLLFPYVYCKVLHKPKLKFMWSSLSVHAAGQWCSPGTLKSSNNKTDCHNINEILLNATRQALMYQNTHNPNQNTNIYWL